MNKDKSLIKLSNSLTKADNLISAREVALNIEEPKQEGDYNAYASRANPNCNILLIDQSENTIEESEKICELINNFIQDVFFQCVRESEIREYIKIYLVPHYNGSAKCVNDGSINTLSQNPIEISTIKKKKKCRGVMKSNLRKKSIIG